MALLLFFKSYIPAHTRRMKNGQIVQVQSYSDKRLRKDAIPVHVDHAGIKAEDKEHWARLHKEQHVLHHTDKALHERRIKEAAEAVEHHNKKAAHHEAQRDLARKNGDDAALSEHNKALTHHHNRAAAWGVKRGNHERHLAKVDSKLEGIKALKEKLWAGSGDVGEKEKPKNLSNDEESALNTKAASGTLPLHEYMDGMQNILGNDFDGFKHSLPNDWYRNVESGAKKGGKITPEVFESMESGQKYHFNKTYNQRNDAIEKPKNLSEDKPSDTVDKNTNAREKKEPAETPKEGEREGFAIPHEAADHAHEHKFSNVKEANDWIQKRYKTLGISKNEYLSSDEYKELYPQIKAIYDAEVGNGIKQQAEKYADFSRSGKWDNGRPFPKIGESVTNMMHGFAGLPTEVTGRVFKTKDGLYRVRIDKGQSTGGASTVKLTYGWISTKAETSQDGETNVTKTDAVKPTADKKNTENSTSKPKITPTGKTNAAKTIKGMNVDTQFAVVEAGDLVTSHDANGKVNADYPKELQPRNRGKDTSKLQISKIANDIDPDRLGRSRATHTGAPIVGDDGFVESGNGRTLAIRQAYQTGKAGEYKDWLGEIAGAYGLDTKAIQNMKNPVLVRVRTTPMDISQRAQFAREAGKDDVLEMTATENAKSDASYLTDKLLNKLVAEDDLTSASNRGFIAAFMGELGDNESSQFIDSQGKPTKQVYDRAQAAIFAKAYNDDRLLELMADDAKPDIANIIKSLNQAAPSFIKARSLSEHHTQATTGKLTDAVDVSLDKQAIDAIVKATEALKKAKDSNMPIEKLIAQGDMFGGIDPVVAQMALFIKDNNKSASRMGEAFTAMADYLVHELEHSQNDSLFGDEEPINIVDVIKAANAQLEKHYGDKVKAIGSGTNGGFIDIFTETRGQKADREAFLSKQPDLKKSLTQTSPLLLFFRKTA